MSTYDTAIDESEYDLEGGGSEDDANDAAFTEYQDDEPPGRRDTTFAPDVLAATASATLSAQPAAATRDEHQDQQLLAPPQPRDDDACPLENTQETAYTVATTATASSNGSLYSASTNDFPTVPPPTHNAQESTVNLQEYNGKSPLDDPSLATNKTLHDTMNDICLHASTGADRPSRLRTVPTRLTDQSWLEAANKKQPGKGGKTADIAATIAEVAPMHNLFGDALGDGGGDDGGDDGGGITTANTNDTDDPAYPDPVESSNVPQKTPKARLAVAAAATTATANTTTNTATSSGNTAKRAANIPTWVRNAVSCGICDQCVKDVCGRCRGCHEPASTTLNRWCVLKCCTVHVPTIGEWYERAIDRMLKVKEDLHKNQAIYCYWEDSTSYWEGSITKIKKERSGELFYDVAFDDGDKRSQVPAHDILTLYEMELTMEQNRLEDARGFDPHASLSTASSRGKGRPKKDETAKERKQTKPREVEKPKKSGKRPAAAAATATVEPPVQEARGKAKGSSVVAAAAASKKPRAAENQKQATRATEETNGRNRNNGQPRGLSKAVGDRVYARWSNGQYYWGRITEVVRNGKAVLYRVLFDDGDKLDVAARYVYAEAECMDLDDNSDDDNAESDAGADVEIEQQSEHALYQKGFCMKWRDVYGLVRTSFGRIGELAPCPEGSADVGYTVEYKRSNDVVGVSGTEIHEVTQVVVTEKVAWGGYMAYMREIGAPTPKHNVPFYLTWRLPDTRRMDRHGRLELEIRGFRLLFQVQTSSIPCVQTAGIGLTVTATDLTGENRASLVLAPGELIGLGRYAPMTESDRKPKHVFEVKNFIHGNGPLSYVQDPNRHDGIVFDPTDDKTGSLNDAAVKNPLVRVNETDGMEVPSVMADFDPCGGVQFFLGHGEEAFGELRIPADEPLELKIDHGERNERNRVLLKYPRLQGRALDKFQLSVANADEQTLSRFKSFDVNQVHECLTFLNSLFLPYWGAPHHKLQKCLLVALILQGRLAVISKKADTLTTAFMRNSDIVMVAKGLVVTVCNQWSDAEQLKNAIVSSPVLKKEVVKSLRMKMQDLEVCCPRKLQQKLRNL